MKNEAIADFYNQIDQKFGSDYEKERWFRNPVTQSHFRMTTSALTDALKDISFKKCLEVGPGAGTWTKLLLLKEPNAQFTLLDISEKMLSMAKDNVGMRENVAYVTSDFLKYTEEDSNDLFFSSRAIEYFDDQGAAVLKIPSLMSGGGEGIIITKNPRYWAYKLLGRRIPEMHRTQISAARLKALLTESGLHVTSVRPATVTVPFFKSARLNDVAFKLLRTSWIPFIHSIFAESYLIRFHKPS